MPSSTPIDILRPAGNYRAFDQQVTLGDQRYRMRFDPAEPARASGWWWSLLSVLSEPLVLSIRLVATTDLIAFARALVPGLPPGRIRVTCPHDPQLGDLAVPGLVVMTYEVD